MEGLRRKYLEWLTDFHNGENLFFTGFILYLGRNVWETTTFPLPRIVTLVGLLLPILLIGLKILLFDQYQARSFCFLILVVVGTVASCYVSTYTIPFFWLLLVIGSKDISFEKILKVYLVVAGSIIFLAVLASLLGVIENFQYVSGDRGTRNSLGVIYPTDFGAHIFYLILTFYYLKGEKLRFFHYIITLAAAGLLYLFCNARLDTICILLTAALFGMGQFIRTSNCVSRKIKWLWGQCWSKAGWLSIPFFALASIWITMLYDGSSRWEILDNTLVARLKLGKEGIEKYGFCLFGQSIKMVGNGGGVELEGDYFFIDCSYLFILLQFGVLFSLVMLAGYCFVCCKNRYDPYFQYAIALIALNSAIAHHFVNVEYNPFGLAILSGCVRSMLADPDIRWMALYRGRQEFAVK